MAGSAPCSECRQHLNANAFGPPHPKLALVRAKAFRGVMAGVTMSTFIGAKRATRSCVDLTMAMVG